MYVCMVILPGFCRRQKGFLLSVHGPRWWCGCQSLASLTPAGHRDYDFMSSLPCMKSLYALIYSRTSAITHLFDIVTCDRFTFAVNRSLCNNEDIQTGATASLLRGTEKTFKINKQSFFLNQIQIRHLRQCRTRHLHLSVFCTDAPPILLLGASLG